MRRRRHWPEPRRRRAGGAALRQLRPGARSTGPRRALRPARRGRPVPGLPPGVVRSRRVGATGPHRAAGAGAVDGRRAVRRPPAAADRPAVPAMPGRAQAGAQPHALRSLATARVRGRPRRLAELRRVPRRARAAAPDGPGRPPPSAGRRRAAGLRRLRRTDGARRCRLSMVRLGACAGGRGAPGRSTRPRRRHRGAPGARPRGQRQHDPLRRLRSGPAAGRRLALHTLRRDARGARPGQRRARRGRARPRAGLARGTPRTRDRPPPPRGAAAGARTPARACGADAGRGRSPPAWLGRPGPFRHGGVEEARSRCARGGDPGRVGGTVPIAAGARARAPQPPETRGRRRATATRRLHALRPPTRSSTGPTSRARAVPPRRLRCPIRHRRRRPPARPP